MREAGTGSWDLGLVFLVDAGYIFKVVRQVCVFLLDVDIMVYGLDLCKRSMIQNAASVAVAFGSPCGRGDQNHLGYFRNAW